MPFIDRAGHRIHYETSGDPAAPPLLLIMGLALGARAWDTLPERFSRRYRVLVFDNRGTGRSGRKGWSFHMRDLADDAAAVLRAASVSEVKDGKGGAAIFGISMGGMIAQELALRHPELVSRLVLGATHAGWLRSRKPTLPILRDLLASLAARDRAKADVVGRYLVSAAWHAQHPRAALDWIQRAERTTLRFALAQIAAIARHTAERRLSRIRVPTLVITGDEDKLVPHQNSLRLSQLIPHAQLLILRGAGHAFPLEREDEVVSALERFLG
jgi:pimeloyl-ACP methyl ester carboxylesterase